MLLDDFSHFVNVLTQCYITLQFLDISQQTHYTFSENAFQDSSVYYLTVLHYKSDSMEALLEFCMNA